MSDKADFAKLLLKHGYSGVKKIGEGSFGVAVLVQDAEGGKSVCKSVKVGAAAMEDLLTAKKEARLLANLDHPNIVRYRSSFLDLGWFCIVMDFCDGGSLEMALQRAIKKSSHLQEEQIIRWFTQAILALEYLHGKGILHRDLKPGNLFLSKRGDLVVGDFGLSKVLDCTVACAKTLVGTPYYLSPEVIQDKPYFWPSDIWSMGCILYEMCALKVPFDSKNLSVLAQKICFGPLPELPSHYSSGMQELCFDLMNREADERPSAEDIVKRPLIQEVASKEISRAVSSIEDNAKAKFVVQDKFRELDLNGDGVVDKEELGHVLKHLDSAAWSDRMVTELLETVDTNKDGLIQLDEFLEWIFGGSDKVGLVERCQQNMEIATSDVSEEDITSLKATLLQWRQAVDIGCLSILPPSACVQTCETLAGLALEVHSLLEEKAEDKNVFRDCFAAIEQMSAILHGIEQLLIDYSRQRVRRVCGLTNASGLLTGLCFELADGTRNGQSPAGLGDTALASGGTATWEMLADGEQILEVKGFPAPAPASTGTPGAVSPAPKGRSRFTLATAAAKSKAKAGPDRSPSRQRTVSGEGPGTPASGAPETPTGSGEASEILADTVTLCTSRGRELHFGGSSSSARGAPFSFKAPGGEEVEDAIFTGSTCTGLKTLAAAPIVVTWDFWEKRKVEKVQAAFRKAADAVVSTLLNWSWRRGSKQGKYALLQARRLGLPHPFVPDEVKARQQDYSKGMTPPGYWDLSAMKLVHGTSVGSVMIDPDFMREVQELVDATYIARRPRSSDSRSVKPRGIEVVRAARLQNWQTWADFHAQQEIIRSEIAQLRKKGSRINNKIASLRTSGFLESLRLPMDEETNCVWLFHLISTEAVDKVTASSFDVDQAGHPGGTLYGRGIYLSECSNQVDELSPGPDKDGMRCMLLCRAALGNALLDDALLPDVVRVVSQCIEGNHHSVQGNRDKHDPSALRDFVVYDKDQVYPEFVLQYRRIYD